MILTPPAPLPLSEAQFSAQDHRRLSVLRRRALLLAGLRTYTYGNRQGQVSILCLCCGLGSPNLGDIKNRYCGLCHVFHDDPFEVEGARPLNGALRTLEDLTRALDERGVWVWESGACKLYLMTSEGEYLSTKCELREAAEEVRNAA